MTPVRSLRKVADNSKSGDRLYCERQGNGIPDSYTREYPLWPDDLLELALRGQGFLPVLMMYHNFRSLPVKSFVG